MKQDSRIYVAGHKGLVGSAILRKLVSEGYDNQVTNSHNESRESRFVDLTRQEEVEFFFKVMKPEYVFLAAAKVGGIMANATSPADFIYNNISIQTNVIHAAYRTGVKKLLFLGSSCIYPRNCPQPMKEEHLLSSSLEPTNEAYAIAKISGIKMCQSYNRQHRTNYISVMPANLYGPGDNFNLDTSHVLPALIRKVHEAKMSGQEEVEIWGTGSPRREFLHVDDLADACVYLMNNYDGSEIINIGVGRDLTIRELAEMISQVVGFTGSFRFDITKPDGTPVKLLDITKLSDIGWHAEILLREGIERAYEWYLENV